MKKQHIALPVLLLALPFLLLSQDLPRIEPLAGYEALARKEGDLTLDEFIDISIRASGTERVDYYRKAFDLFIDEMDNELEGLSGDYEKGEELLRLLHDKLFRNYEEDQTRIDLVFDTGNYNCVSSAIIYMAAGRSAGLDIQGVRTWDHAFISVISGTEIIDVETTNLWGFDPGQKKEFTDSFTGSTGYNYVPPGNYRLRKDISDKQMIGLILQNRIAELQRRGNHKDSVSLAVDRYALTASDEAGGDMFDTFSNYSSLLNGTGQYERGILFLTGAMDRWGTSDKVVRAFEALVHNHILTLVEAGMSSEAERFLEKMEATAYMTSEAVQSDRAMIYDRRTVELLNSGEEFSIVREYLNNVYEEGFLSSRKWMDYTLYIYVKESEIIAVRDGWLEAYRFVIEAPLDIQNTAKYRQLLDSCRGNYVVTVHNRFADLYNRGLFTEARTVLEEGLLNVPGDRTLTSDLQLIDRKSF